MSKLKLVRVCAGCGLSWRLATRFSSHLTGIPCRQCGSLSSTRVPPETATIIVARYRDAVQAALSTVPDAKEADETNRLLFGG